MSAGDDLRVGLVGCGRLAEIGYLPALRLAAGVRLVAVADPDPQRRRLAPVAGFDSAGALLASVPVDALILATPASAHLPDAQAAAAAGVATLVEKPPAVDAAGAAALARLRPAPWIGFNRRFAAGSAALRAAVPVRRPVDLRLELCYRRASWRAHTVADDALLDLGGHLVDLARWVSGSEAQAVRAARVSFSRAEFEVLLDRGRARIRCATDRPHLERFEVRDAHGRLLARQIDGGVRNALRARLDRHAPHPLVASLRRQVEAFAATLRGAAHPALATAEDGRAALQILDAVRACALRGGKEVSLAVA